MYKYCCTLGGELNPTLIHLESISSFMLLESTWRYQWFKSISESLITMNFARAARGTPTRESMLREVDSQAEIELGRHLDAAERGIIMSRFPIEVIVRCIDKVSNIFIHANAFNYYCSMGLARLSFYSSLLRDS